MRFRWSRGSVLAFGTQLRGFIPGRSRRIFRAKKILSTLSFGGEVKPSVPCRNFTACKRSLNITWRSAFRHILPDISRPQFHLPPLGALARWRAWRSLVEKVGTSNSYRTISLRLQCVVKKHNIGLCYVTQIYCGLTFCVQTWGCRRNVTNYVVCTSELEPNFVNVLQKSASEDIIRYIKIGLWPSNRLIYSLIIIKLIMYAAF